MTGSQGTSPPGTGTFPGKKLPRIVFMGTPDFAVRPLLALIEAGYPVIGVATKPDSPRDRGKQLHPSAVKKIAQEQGLPVMEPTSLKRDPAAVRQLAAWQPDLVIVAAYGLLLPQDVLDLPPAGCINLHASLLPRHRGAAPIQRAILAGDDQTGITLMQMSAGLDEGDMIARAALSIGLKTAGRLTDELSELGAALLLDTLPAIWQGTAPRQAQDPALATYAPPIQKTEARIDFDRPAAQIERQIRAMAPQPGAFAFYGETRWKILEALVLPEDRPANARPGQILAVEAAGIAVAAADQILRLTRLQAPGKAALAVSEYIKGNKIEIGLNIG